jgi:rhamnogalacturonyl hydrolase YesR
MTPAFTGLMSDVDFFSLKPMPSSCMSIYPMKVPKLFFRVLLAMNLALLGATASRAEQPAPSMNDVAREQFAFAAQQYSGLLKRMDGDATRQPRTWEKGKFRAVSARDWTSGFFPGSLWLIYEQTGEAGMRNAAEDFSGRVKEIQHFTGHHDVGFMLGCSYGEGLRITGEEAYRAILVQGARSLATRYDEKVGLIRSWDAKEWKYPVIVDNMMNLELLWHAYKQTGEPLFREIAMSHADKTLANHFRPDGSSFHLLDYDPKTGDVIKRQTVQGAADDSAWARGQAWGLYGFATMARLTGEARYLERARQIAAFVMNHPRLPEDAVPYWDFDAPEIPNAPRDASAAAIMAGGLLELSDHVPAEEASRYRAFAEKQLRSLASPAYRATLNENGNFLLMHCVGHKPAGSEIDVPLNYADYYFLKALSRYATPAVKAAGAY